MYALTAGENAVHYEGIAEAATESLQNSPYPAVRSILCEWDQGILFLRGKLSSFYHKQLAQEAVARIPGMTRLVNEAEELLSAVCVKAVPEKERSPLPIYYLAYFASLQNKPAQAVYEHEILNITSNFENPVHLENLAGHSRYTLRQMRKKTQKLCLEGHAREELDAEAGVITYHFPSIDYPRDFYKKNMELIESYPSSVMEEVQMKVVQILFSLGILILGLFVLGFLHVPFPFLALLFFVAGPAIAFFVWRRRKKVEED